MPIETWNKDVAKTASCSATITDGVLRLIFGDTLILAENQNACVFYFLLLNRHRATQKLKKASWNRGTPCQVASIWLWLQMKPWRSALSKSITHRSCQTKSPIGRRQATSRDSSEDLVSLPFLSILRHPQSTWTFRDISLTHCFLPPRGGGCLSSKPSQEDAELRCCLAHFNRCTWRTIRMAQGIVRSYLLPSLNTGQFEKRLAWSQKWYSVE